MRRPVVLIPLLLLAVVVGTQVDWKLVIAPLIGLAIWSWASATLRSFANHGTTGVAASIEPEVVSDRPERIFYWCGECSTEVLLLVRGSGSAPRHCGERMHERAELPRRGDALTE